MRVAAIALLAIVLSGCADKTYYACRDGGNSREFCSSGAYVGLASGHPL